MKNQRGFAPVIVILVVLIGFVGVYFLGTLKNKPSTVNPTSSPVAVAKESAIPTVKPVATTDLTADWKTYTNTKFGFSFKYPTDFKTTLSPTTGEEFNLVVDKKTNVSEMGFVPVQFSINMSRDENNMIRNITTLSQAEEIYKINRNQTRKSILLDNKSAVTVAGLVEGLGPGTGQFLSYTFVKLNNEVLIIQLGNKDYQTELNQILSTFKFTN